MFTALALFFLFLSEKVRITLPLKFPLRVRANFVFLSVVFSKREKKPPQKKFSPKKRRRKRAFPFSAAYAAISYLRKKIGVTVYLPNRSPGENAKNPYDISRQSAISMTAESVLFGFIALFVRSFIPVDRPFSEGAEVPVAVVDTTVFHLFVSLFVFAFSSFGRKKSKFFG